MHIQIVNFHLHDLSDEQFRSVCSDIAPAYADVPGMISKVWLANRATNTYGGVYTWDTREAMETFSRSDLFNAVATNANFVGVTSVDFDVLDGPTRVTHGAPAQRAAVA